VLFKGQGITVKQIRAGLSKAFWPGRMEEILPEVFVDGAHNGDGIRAFLDSVRSDGLCGERSRTLIFGVVQDKDYESMVKQVLDASLFDTIYLAHMKTKRAVDPEDLRLLWEREALDGVRIVCCGTVQEALEAALSGRNDGRIYIAGSLYLVGEIKEFLRYDQF